MKHLKNPRSWVIASFLVGFVLTMSGWWMWESQTPQTQWYNRGLVAYNSGNYQVAIEDFDKSMAAFQSALNEKRGPLTAPASLEIAQLAQCHKFKALIKMKNGKLAVAAIKEGLKLSTAWNISHFELSEAEIKKIQEDRIVCQTNLEILFKQQQEMAQAEGKGKGGQQGEPGDKPSDNPANGNQSGKTPRDAL